MTEIEFIYREVVLNEDTEERICDRLRLKGSFDVFLNGHMTRVSGQVKQIENVNTQKNKEDHMIFECTVTVEGKAKRYGKRKF